MSAHPELAKAMEQMMRTYEAGWVDEPIPALGGSTPRQAVTDPKTRPHRPMTTSRIAAVIAEQSLFTRPGDGRPPPPSQVSARIGNKTYRDRFERTMAGIRLRDS